ncbi:Xaa-Pro dipeptidyl-peptidase [Lentilactobacillus buchneri]|uniref:Xaa-Pro dipeptidyl-peptidase n=1 Tax=Lentilactobacillus buchneri DSM 20057 TaxID=1423728 RepID=A0A4R5NSM0_LENBU|nr:Xaa-Pro dipeptidyl-peptidase [Lentilactobacillus buchneri]WCJ52364.1 Xaa-Pro dipeptidyl-peptidase [Lentilactobacillus sp. Egmn17]MCT2881441.1 Xaa-Pro dipeptidyl-peptidase [Lentilactobacillus buchneri]MCT2898844.1 Xaa-Pro dipeptidyl-peptidase [Lentilactobacillus buchneri]MCT3252220.1 Xaa-Pro dipeptidyl-peptidase [Lentilactobacillus buchneri]MCT3546809.1 Xaa-Pro dipeptidyl-peptidase [Lentilactobacillus buchneri]
MKINQFAYVPTDHHTIVKELADVHFLTAQTKKMADPVMLYRQFLLKFFIEKQSLATRIQKVANLMATPTLNAYEFTTTQAAVSKLAFYNVGLQLLGFEVGLDFELNDPFSAMKKYRLPMAVVDDTLDRNQVIDAWYKLLNTRTKFGQTLIDYLAGQGYYHQFFGTDELKRPLIFNGKSQAVFDTTQLIRDVVYVEAPLDNDHDGKRDLLKAEIIRPGETENGLKVPVIFTASPYDQGTNDHQADQMTHDVNQEKLTRKQPNHLSYDDVKFDYDNHDLPEPRTIKDTNKVAEESFVKTWTYSLNDYFLARGFAVVYSSGVGTKDSDGVRTTGTPDETISATSVIEWLHGDRTAFTNRSDQIAIPAWWSNGNVGMTGRSYLGTLSTAAAMTGVDGLKTAVVEAGISNYYDYYRENGLVVAPGGFQGEDTDVLGELTFSREQSAADYLKIKDTWLAQLKKLTAGQDRVTGSYNSFWDNRNLLKNVNIKADMLLVHGLNDWNVKLSHVYNLRNTLKNEKITQKLVLHQGQHEYLNNFRSVDFTDIVNLWLTNKLLAVDNQANQIVPDVLVQDNAEPETWNTYKDWGGNVKEIPLDDKRWTDLNENHSFSDQLPDDLFKDYIENTKKWQKALFTKNHSKLDKHSIKLVSEPLDQDITVDGRATITLRAASSADLGLLSAALVDYGVEKRLTAVPQILSAQQIITGYQWRKDDLKEFLPEKKASAYKKFTDAHMNMQNRTNNYQSDDLKPGQYSNFTIAFQPTFWRLLKGHQLGLIIYATDMDYTIRSNQDISYTVDLSASKIELPLLTADDKQG